MKPKLAIIALAAVLTTTGVVAAKSGGQQDSHVIQAGTNATVESAPAEPKWSQQPVVQPDPQPAPDNQPGTAEPNVNQTPPSVDNPAPNVNENAITPTPQPEPQPVLSEQQRQDLSVSAPSH